MKNKYLKNLVIALISFIVTLTTMQFTDLKTIDYVILSLAIVYIVLILTNRKEN